MKEQYKKQSGFPPYIIALMDSIDVHVICYSAIRAIVDRISKENKLTALGIAISKLLEDQVRLAIFKETAQGHYKTLEADLKAGESLTLNTTAKTSVYIKGDAGGDNVRIWGW